MTWLLAHMWIALAATGVVTLLLGWSIRGMMLSGKMRQAIVERDMVKVELGDAKDEIERLFTAQRKMASGEPVVTVAQDPIAARKVESLTAELARKSAEIDALKAAALAAPAAPVAAASAAPAEESLAWRNRHLESRVAHLEAELAKAPQAAAPVAAAAVVAAPAAAADTAKLEWEVNYLRTRVQGLEAELAAVPPPAEPVVVEAPAAPAHAEPTGPVEEEIARLRWRVRFLEGRLAYFEGGTGATDAPAAEAAADPAPSKPAAEAILDQLEQADERADAAASGQVARVRPVALERPVEGAAADLTLIGGIGPKIQDVLNSLGIYHFDQIADWTPENVAWVDEYLSFSGRITREGWVEQAAVLVDEAADA